MTEFFYRTIGRINKRYLITHYALVIFFLLFIHSFTKPSDYPFLILLSILAVFYPFAAFSWDYIFQNFNSNVFLVTGFTFILWILWKITKFLFLLTFGPLITLVLFTYLYFFVK